MNARIERLRKKSFEATPCISIERALIETEFYKKQQGKQAEMEGIAGDDPAARNLRKLPVRDEAAQDCCQRTTAACVSRL